MNRDEGSYQLSHAYDRFLDTRRLPVVSRIGRTEYQLLLMKASDRCRNVKFQVIFWLCFDEFNLIVNFQPDESIQRAELLVIQAFMQSYQQVHDARVQALCTSQRCMTSGPMLSSLSKDGVHVSLASTFSGCDTLQREYQNKRQYKAHNLQSIKIPSFLQK